MRLATVVIAFTLIASGCSPSADSGDVATYRGDSARTGAMPGPGPSGDPEIVWQFQAGAQIRSSPAVVGGSVFVASVDGTVHALELATGAAQWSALLGAEVKAATPLVIDGLVVVGDQAGVVHALDQAGGAERWRASTDGPIDGAVAEGGGLVLLATASGSAYALDPSSGEIRWRADLPGGVSRSIAATDELVYCAVSGGLLVSLRTSDGSPVWQASMAADGEGGTPTVADGLVFAATGLDSDSRETQGIVALDARTGAERWRHASPSGAVMYAPAVADGIGYIVTKDEQVVAVDAGSGEVRWTATTGATNDALASIWDTTVYVATNGGRLMALDADTGVLRWHVAIVGAPYSPAVVGGLVLVATNVGVLYAFGDARP
jgi:eukaryotic-like serine/threonine-protein kinase